MPVFDLPRIIAALRDFLHRVQDHNSFSGKLGYDEALAKVNLASAAVRVNESLGQQRVEDPELDQACNMLRANVSRLSIEPANHFLLEIVQRATAALERIQARKVQESDPSAPEPE